MKRALSIFSFIAMVFAGHASFAEDATGKITGTVVDASTGQPVEFATVALIDPQTNKPIDGTVCDEKGRFTINKVANGNYKLVISFIGYETYTQDVAFTDRKNNIELPAIKLGTSVTQLNEVVVEGQRSLVEEKVDRTIYNAENDATTRGGDGTDVLRRVPMLTVDTDGNVSMRGNSNVRVLINGKPSTIAASSVADALKQIPADQIKSVEVITSPSAKYDAEGSAGIINIITKKNNMQGFTLGIDAGAGLRGSNLGLNGSLRTGKMGFSLGGWGRSNYNITGSYLNDQVTTQEINGTSTQIRTTQEANTLNRGIFGNYNLGWDYDINKFNSLNASVRLGARNGRNFQNDLLSQVYDANENLTSSSLRNVDVKDFSNNLDANLTYTRLFEKQGKELSFMGSFNRNDRNNNFINNILDQNDLSIDSRLRNDNKSFNQEMTVQIDYETPINNNHKIELGAKNIMRSVSSHYQYFTSVGEGEYVPASGSVSSNDFDYNQNVTAGYLSYTVNLPKQYALKAGTRYEYTTIDANFVNQEKITIPSYSVVVPSVNLSRKLKNGSSIKAAYNRRIQRPSLQFLNPNLQVPNAASASVGNPNLEPEYTNNYELAYSAFVKKVSLNVSAFARNTNNAIQSVREPATININGAESNVILTTYQNIGSENAYGSSIFTNINMNDKFTLNGGVDVYYAVLSNNSTDPKYNASNQGWVYSGRLFGNYNFTKLWGLQFFSFYRGRDVQLQGTRGGFAMYALSLKRDFANKKGSVGLGVENFLNFNGWKVKSETISPIVVQHSTNVMNNLSFRVNISYRIGKMSFENQPRRGRSVNNDDLKGDGGGNDNGGGMGGGMPQGMGNGGGQRQGNARMPVANAPKLPAGDPNAVIVAEGTWDYSLDSPQGGTGVIVIKKDGANYTGTITSSRNNNKETPLASVIVKGNEITIAYDNNFGGNTVAIQIKGLIVDNALNGTMSIGQFASFPIKATKKP